MRPLPAGYAQIQNMVSYIDKHKILWYKSLVIDLCAYSAEMRGAGRSRSVRGRRIAHVVRFVRNGVAG